MVGFVAFLGLDFLIERKILDLGQDASSSPFFKAIIIGFSTQWLSTVNVFDAGPGRSVGVKLLFDKLNENIALDEKVAVMSYLEALEQKFSTVHQVRDAIRKWQPPGKDDREHKAFLNELSLSGSVHDALLQCLRFCGKSICDQAFRT